MARRIISPPVQGRVKVAARVSLAGDARPRRYGFALTPLADAMFQLLIFFMLSSSLSSYSLLTLSGGIVQAAVAIDPGAATVAGAPVVWQLSHDVIRVEGQMMAFDALPDVALRMRGEGRAEVVILPDRTATVQDVATVLDVMSRTGGFRVQLVSGSTLGGG